MSKPEVLAPVGDYQVLQAALQAGADAVYFGLAEGFNARARAQNFTLDKLKEIVREIHASGVKAYITLNTLVFESELPKLKELLSQIAQCQVDALIIQDLGLARLAAHLTPQIPLHASTQMTLSDGCAARLAKALGFQRVVLARELNTAEIAEVKKEADCELEVFALGALCVSFSGQCLASLAWGGRSANRGQCAQPCRLPFRWAAIPQGEKLDFSSGQVKLSPPSHLLSPCDLAGFNKIDELIRANVSSLKIEGRLKGVGYVYMAVKTMRQWVEAHFNQQGGQVCPNHSQVLELRRNLSDLQVTFSRGFTPGFLSSVNHQTFIQKGYPKHRGQLLGTVIEKNIQGIKVKLTLPDKNSPSFTAYPIIPQNGLGVLFLSPIDENNRSEEVQGGPIYSCLVKKGLAILGFGKNGPNFSKINIGDLVYVTSSPQTTKRINQALLTARPGRIGLHLSVYGSLGQPLTIRATTKWLAQEFTVSSQATLRAAQKSGLTATSLAEKFSELANTPFHIANIETQNLASQLFLPLSELKPMRRALVAQIEAALESKETVSTPTAKFVLPSPQEQPYIPMRSSLTVLCRTLEQTEAALELGCDSIELEAFKPEKLNLMVKAVRSHPDVCLYLAAPRIKKQNDHFSWSTLLEWAPEGLLLRNLGSLQYMLDRQRQGETIPSLHGDFSFNITNSLTADSLLRLGLDTFTPSDDLDEVQLLALINGLKSLGSTYPPSANPVSRLVFTLYRRMPTFHTQHCLYANLLSSGTNSQTCGQPCLKKDLYIIDRLQYSHLVRSDYCCRNTIFAQTPEQRQKLLPKLSRSGVCSYRLEFLDENSSQVKKIFTYYNNLLQVPL